MAKTVTYNCERERAKASGGVESEIATGCCERRERERETEALLSSQCDLLHQLMAS